ncbi:Protein phosphatase PP2A regulatory subunit B [Gonapodya sp. JEL0774]|nr:Protein phosphatase PP2A regulatory subunit B [Gonapodya sp. JEL0774]
MTTQVANGSPVQANGALQEYTQPQFVQPAAQASGPNSSNPNAPPPGQNASLYVGELDPNVTEAMLFDVFNMVGPVASIRVCRDAVTRRSLGYAYVNFHNFSDCQRALEQLNYSVLKGRPIRIMWSQRDPSLRKSGTGNIFIKNLDPSIDNKALHDTFSAFGIILSCKVAFEDGSSKGYGFVHYEAPESAEQAIKHVNGMLLNDRKVYVGLHVPKKERVAKTEELKAKFTNVYVKNLDEEVDDDEFRSMFEQFGPITSAVVSRDDMGKSRGFGFVNFDDHESADKAVEAMNDTEHRGKRIYVARAQKKAEREEELRRQYERVREEKMNKYQGVNLYVKNLDDTFDDDKLRQEFSQFGTITSAKVMKDEKQQGVSKGFGFVCFSSPDEATKAVAEMNGRMIGSKPIYVALAQRKEARKQQLEAQMRQRVQIGIPQAMAPPMYPAGPVYFPPQGMPGAGPMGARPGMYFGGALPRPRPQQWSNAPQPGQPGGSPYPGGMPPQPYPGQMQQPGMGRGVRPPRPAGRGGPPMQTQSMIGPNGMPVPVGPGQLPPRPQGMPGGPLPGVMMPQGMPGGPAGPGMGGVRPPMGRGAYKYTPQARNAPAGQMPLGPNGLPMGGPMGGATRPTLNASTLASLPFEQQKRTLGEALYPLIQQQSAEFAGKVTGMLLEMDNTELLHLLETPEELSAKVAEAVTVLQEHLKKRQQQQALAAAPPPAEVKEEEEAKE